MATDNSKNKTVTEEHRKKFLDFINRDGIHYERILLEQHYSRVRSILLGGNPPPYELEIQSSGGCDAGCLHCFGRLKKKLPDLLTESAMERIVDDSLGFEKDGFTIETIKFCGSTGEPLVNPATLHAIDYLNGRRYLRLFTNGLALARNKGNKNYVETVSKVNRLNISIDSDSTETLHRIKPGSRDIQLEDILEAGRRIRETSGSSICVEAGYVITYANYKGTENFVRRVKETGAADTVRFRIDLMDRTISRDHGVEISEAIDRAIAYTGGMPKVVPLHSEGEIEETNESYFNSRESGLRCFTSRIWACIGPDGYLFPCGHMVCADSKPYGGVLENGLASVWESKERQALVSELPNSSCEVCSPFSLRINRFLTEISQWPIEEVDALYGEYIQKPASKS
jgi:radical SAM protein with 4Fe4S-binding SPASM domain